MRVQHGMCESPQWELLQSVRTKTLGDPNSSRDTRDSIDNGVVNNMCRQARDQPMIALMVSVLASLAGRNGTPVILQAIFG